MIQRQTEIASYINSVFSLKRNIFFRIHSIFKNAVNFFGEDIFFTVTNNSIPVSPLSIVILDDKDFYSITDRINSSSYCVLDYPHLKFDDFYLSLENSNVINTEIPSYSSLSYQDMVTFKSNVLKWVDPKNSLLNIYHNGNICNHLIKEFKGVSNSLHESIKNWNPNDFSENVKKILGLGSGLTPSGDDFLYGLLSVWKIFSRGELLIKELEETIIGSKNSISTISYYFLKALTENHIFFPLKELLHLVKCRKEYREKLLCIESFGSTSGIDMLAGVIFGLEN